MAKTRPGSPTGARRMLGQKDWLSHGKRGGGLSPGGRLAALGVMPCNEMPISAACHKSGYRFPDLLTAPYIPVGSHLCSSAPRLRSFCLC